MSNAVEISSGQERLWVFVLDTRANGAQSSREIQYTPITKGPANVSKDRHVSRKSEWTTSDVDTASDVWKADCIEQNDNYIPPPFRFLRINLRFSFFRVAEKLS